MPGDFFSFLVHVIVCAIGENIFQPFLAYRKVVVKFGMYIWYLSSLYQNYFVCFLKSRNDKQVSNVQNKWKMNVQNVDLGKKKEVFLNGMNAPQEIICFMGSTKNYAKES